VCTDAYREALTRDLSAKASSRPAPGERQAVERAIERGDLPAGTDPASVLRALIAPVYFRLTVTAESVDQTAADQAAQMALAAARAGVFKRAASEGDHA
jgi:Tetracyclin repressor-like, C-terminal domain